jgi:uncharacterized protein (TIGR02466 family)|tara:strand:- start:715 stop:1320 length:606 start_codon:yes stop_codon:yes gene_type:complete
MNSLFPTILHEFEVPTFKQIEKDLIKSVYEERRKDSKGRSMTNVGGWQSRAWYYETETHVLGDFIQKEVVDYFEKNRIFKSGAAVQFLNWWININKKGDYNMKHVHPGSTLSGVVYLQVPKGSGKIIFDSPHMFSNFNEYKSYSTEIVESFNLYSSIGYETLPGHFLVFPSDILHGVEVNQSREDRISLSFNIGLPLGPEI